MAELDADRFSVFDILSKNIFNIPDYQRPYAWTDVECQTLWDDLKQFAFPGDDTTQFDPEKDEYFLGPMVTYKNGNVNEVIDGQQRLTTLIILLRAFYPYFRKQKDENSQSVLKTIGQCIWKTNAYGVVPERNKEIKLSSDVIVDEDRQELMEILTNGEVTDDMKSRYADAYRFFVKQIDEFTEGFVQYLIDFPTRIMMNCTILMIVAKSQDSALQVFSTLNNRGLPLSDSDIFKAQLYGYYKEKGEDEKLTFIQAWKELECQSKRLFGSASLDEIFTRYMYYLRAKEGIDSPTTESMRKFYGKEQYRLLKNDSIMDDLTSLMSFWVKVNNHDKIKKEQINNNSTASDEQTNENEKLVNPFSEEVLKSLFILNNSPNGMWKYVLSAYFLSNRDKDDDLDQEKLNQFLKKIIGFTFAYAITSPGVNSLRTPVYPELVEIVKGKDVLFSKYKFNKQDLLDKIAVTDFNNSKAITKSMVSWYAFQNDEQDVLPIDVDYHVEHIYASKRHEIQPLSDKKNLECLGNKALLEYSINIRASDYKFSDKKDYYLGLRPNKKKNQKATKNAELIQLAKTKCDFTEDDIKDRNKTIIEAFINYLDRLNLMQ